MIFGNYSQFNMRDMGSSMGYQNFLGDNFGFGNSDIGLLLGGSNMFQRCDGTYNYDAMAGIAVGNIFAKCLFAFIGKVASSRQAKKADSPETKLSNLDSQINDELKKFPAGFNTVETYKNCKIENTTEYTTWKALSDKCNANQKVVDTYDVLNDATIDSYTELHKKWVAATGDEKTTLKNQLDSMKSDYDQAKKAQQEYNQAKNALETDKPKLEAAETAKNEKATEISAAQTKLAELIASKDVITTESNDKILDKADGHKWQQSSDKFDKTTGEYSNLNTVQDGSITKGEVRYAIQLYRNAKATDNANNHDKVKKLAQQVVTLYDKLSLDDKKDKSLQAAYNLIIQDTL